MRNIIAKRTPKKPAVFSTLSFMLILIAALFMLAGCSSTYGSYKRDAAIYQDFQSDQVNSNYDYYYNGVGNQVYAIVGIEPKYQIHSEFWREVKPDTAEFKKLTNRIWSDYWYEPYGADLLNPSGSKIGIVFTSINEVTVKFLADNQIDVLLGTPYLWGPGVGSASETGFIKSSR